MVSSESDFFGDGEIVVFRLSPVDQVDGLCDLPDFCLHRHAVAKKAVNLLVVAIQAAAVMIRLRMQCRDSSVDLVRRVNASGEERRQQMCFDVAVVVAIAPVPEVAIPKLIAE